MIVCFLGFFLFGFYYVVLLFFVFWFSGFLWGGVCVLVIFERFVFSIRFGEVVGVGEVAELIWD